MRHRIRDPTLLRPNEGILIYGNPLKGGHKLGEPTLSRAGLSLQSTHHILYKQEGSYFKPHF